MSVRNMPAEAVVGLLSQFEIVGIRVWVDGGWAVDALLGHASRPHGDLDIVVQKQDIEQIRGLLESLGYLDKADADTRPWNFVMGDPAGHAVDVHVIDLNEWGEGVYGPPELQLSYPAESLTGHGAIGEHPVSCISPEALVTFHTGYEIDEQDVHDVLALHERFGAPLPDEYRVFVDTVRDIGEALTKTFEEIYSNLSKLREAIRRRGQRSRIILGIDGLSRSGKTTFTERLRKTLIQEQMEVYVFHLDDHIVERRRRYDTGEEAWYEYYALQWDVPYLRENLFAMLHAGKEIVLPFYNCTLDKQVAKTVFVAEESVIIVEGVFLQRPEWRGFLDYCVFLDCPREIRLSRENKGAQANLSKFETRYWKAEDYYLKTVRPAAQADMVIES